MRHHQSDWLSFILKVRAFLLAGPSSEWCLSVKVRAFYFAGPSSHLGDSDTHDQFSFFLVTRKVRIEYQSVFHLLRNLSRKRTIPVQLSQVWLLLGVILSGYGHLVLIWGYGRLSLQFVSWVALSCLATVREIMTFTQKEEMPVYTL